MFYTLHMYAMGESMYRIVSQKRLNWIPYISCCVVLTVDGPRRVLVNIHQTSIMSY
jgi:hypothetical protein